MEKKKTMKCFTSPTGKPCDVEYRLKRCQQLIEKLAIFVAAIDPNVFPEEHATMTSAIKQFAAARNAAVDVAPLKKSHKIKPRSKPPTVIPEVIEASVKKQVKQQREQVAAPVGDSVLDRALAAARARRAAKAKEAA